MASLYRRATLSQQRILRAVEGAVKNATDAHPNLQISPQHRRSIAKRAAGTLTAQWPDVLAASRGSSDSGAGSPGPKTRRRSSDATKATGRGGSNFQRAFPLRRLIAEIARPLSAMRAAGMDAQVSAYVDVLKIIDRLRNEHVQSSAEPTDARSVISAETREAPTNPPDQKGGVG